jgi:hypothetical protein
MRRDERFFPAPGVSGMGTGGLGQPNAVELQGFIWAIQERVLELAKVIPQVAATWRQLDEIRAQTKKGINDRAQADIRRLPSAFGFGPFGIPIPNPALLQIAALAKSNSDRIDGVMAAAYAKLADAVSVMAFLDTKADIVKSKAVGPLREELKLGRYSLRTSEFDILIAIKLPWQPIDTSTGYPEEWIARILYMIRAYVNSSPAVPEEMRRIFSSAVAVQRGKALAAQNMDIGKIAAEAGVSIDQAKEALATAGLGIAPLVIVAIIAISVLAVGGAGVAIGASLSGGKAAKVAGIEIDGLIGLNASQLDEIVAKANEQAAAIAAESDANKRKQLADRAAVELKALAGKDAAQFSAQGQKAKAAINEAGKGLDFSGLILPIGITIGGLIVLKVAKVF